MPRSVNPPPASTSPPIHVALTNPFEDESGVHDIDSLPIRNSELDTQPPPSSDDPIIEVFEQFLSPLDLAPAPPSQRPTPVCPVPELDREACTQPAPALTQPQPGSSNGQGYTQPAPDSDARRNGAGALQSPVGLRPLSIADSLASVVAAPGTANLDVVLHRMKECFTDGDYQGAAEAAGHVLVLRPGHATAASYSRSCQRLLAQRHADRIGDLNAVPVVAMTPEHIRWLALDHREGFLLSLIDGQTSIEDIIDIAGMDRADVLKSIANLIDQEVLRLR